MAPTASPAVNVKDYGAKGDGSSDDTSAIMAALRAVAAKGGGLAYVPDGTYRVTQITIPDGVSVAGEGPGRSWLHGRVTAGSSMTLSDLKIGVGGKAFHFADGSHDSFAKGCRFTGGGDKDSGSESGVIQFSGDNSARNITFQNCIIERNAQYSDDVCLIERGWEGGHYENIVFDGCHFLGAPLMALECVHRPRPEHPTTMGYSVSVLNCTFEPTDSQTISFDGKMSASGQPVNKAVLQNCLIKGGGADPAQPWPHDLEVNAPVKADVSGNTFYAARGTMINWDAGTLGSANSTFTNNTFDGTQGVAHPPDAGHLYLQGSGGLFADNTIKVDSGCQVFLITGSRNTISNNSVTDVRSSTSIRIFDLNAGTSNHIEGNSLHALGGTVVLRTGSNENWFVGNAFETGKTEAQLFNIAAGVTVHLDSDTYR